MPEPMPTPSPASQRRQLLRDARAKGFVRRGFVDYRPIGRYSNGIDRIDHLVAWLPGDPEPKGASCPTQGEIRTGLPFVIVYHADSSNAPTSRYAVVPAAQVETERRVLVHYSLKTP